MSPIATVTALGFNITAKWDGAGLRAAQLQLDTLKKSLSSIDGTNLRIGVTLDDSAARAKLESLRSLVSNQSMTINVNADTTAATAKLTALRDQLDHIGAMHVTATADVNTNTASLEALRLQLEHFGSMRYVAQADVNTDRAHTALSALSRDADDSTSRLRTMSIGASGAGGALAGMGGSAGGASSGLGTMSSASSAGSASLGGLGTAAGVAALAIAAIGPIAALTSAAVLGTLGVAFVGVGALALSQTAVVKQAFTGLKTSVMADALQAAQGMKAPLLQGIAELQTGLHALVPAFSQAFTAAGALIKPMVDSFLQFSQNVMPGVIAALKAAGPVFEGLRTGMAALGTGMSQMFAGMAAGAKGAGAALSVTLSGIGKMLGIIGVAFGQMAGAGAKALAGLMQGLVSLTQGAMAGFVQAVKLMNGTLGPFLAELGKFAGQILQGLLPALAALMTALMAGLTPVMKALGPVFIIVGQAIAKLGMAFAPLMGEIGKLVAAVITALMPAFTQVVQIWAQAGAQLLTALMPAIVKLTPSVVLLVQAVVKLAIAFLPLMPLLVQLDLIFVKLLIACLPVITILIQLAALIIGAFATAIRTIVSLIVNWGTTWQAVTTGFGIAWTAVSGALVVAWNATWNGMSIAARAIWSAMTVAWNAVVVGFATVWTTVSAALVAAWNAVWNGMATAARAIWSALTVAWGAFVTGLTAAWNATASALSAAWSALWNALSAVANAVWNALKAAWQAFCNAMMSVLNAFGQTIQNAWQGMWNIISAAANAVWNALKAGWQAFVNAMMSILNAFGQTIQNAWSGMWNIIKNAAQAVWNALETAWRAFTTAMMSILNAFGQTIQNAWSGMWNIIKSAASAAWSAIETGWRAFSSAMMSILNALGQTLQSAWSGMWNVIKSVASSAWSAVSSGFKSFASGVESTLSALVSGAKKIWDGIVAVFKTPVNAVITIWDVVAGAVGLPKITKLAEGGQVSGPGTGTSDSIPAMLSNGEYVVKASAVSHYGSDKLDAINNMHFANGGLVGDSSIKQNTGKVGGKIASSLGAGVGILNGAPAAMETAHAAIGGIIPNPINTIKKVVKGAVNAVKGVVSDIVGFVKKNIGSIVAVGGAIAPKALEFAKDITGDLVYDFAKPVMDAVVSKVPDPMPPGTPKPAGSVVHAGVKKIADSALGLLKDKQKVAVESKAVAGTKSVAQWASTILQALKLAGAPASWLGGIEGLMAKESGGNPNAINRTDSNAKAGIPSQGLMQVIPPTFAAYHQAGTSNNILDPLANIAAAVNYIQARYGHVPGSPYASGTPSATPGVHLVGENGPEMVLFGGGETVKNSDDTSAMLATSAAGASSGGDTSGGPAVTDLPAQKLAANIALWKTYMQQIRVTSDTAWTGVKTTADTNWSAMQSGVGPFAGNLVKTLGSAGSAIVGDSKTTWTNARNLAANSWADQRANGTAFAAGLQKTFADTGTNIQTKWKTDWAENEAVTAKTWTDQKAESTQFGTDLEKTYTDTSTAMQTSWKTSLTASTADTTKYWTDTKATYTQGTADMQTGFITPVTTMLDTDLPAAFSASVTAIAAGWESLKTTVRDPVAAVVDVVFNQGIVAMWNAIAGTFDTATLDTFTMPGFAVGGAVQGAGTGTSDSITAKLSHGEHVWTAQEVRGAGGHGNVAALRHAAVGGSPVQGAGIGRFATGGAVGSTGTVGAPQGGSSAAAAVPTGADALTAAAGAALGSIGAIANPFIEAAGAAGKAAIATMMPNDAPFKTMLNNMTDQMVGTVTSWITSNDVAPVFSGGANVAAAQAWADSQVGKPYGLGGDFVNTIDCSQFQSGIARVILGQTPAPWFTTFAFVGDTAPEGFQQGLEAPYMVGITNAGVGHMAGTINGTNYEATPPAVRSGPSARGYNDPMFTNQYGFAPSIAAAGGAVTDSNHLAIIDAALSAAGVPPPGTLAAWESGLNTLITRESAWDPNAINLTDSNAQAGYPSQGLAQTIPQTFAAYHVAGTSDNILDPVANVAAAIRYIVATYGDISNVQQANPNLPPAGYRNGTKGAQSGWHRVGEGGTEWVKFRGGEEVLPNGQLPPSNGGHGDVHLSVPITVQGNMDSDAVKRVENELVPKLRMMLQQRRGK